MFEPCRLPLVDSAGRLLGYWYLRQSDNRFLITYQYPNSEHIAKKFFTAEEAVCEFYASFLEYLVQFTAKVEQLLAQLPKHEYNRPGFRPGWLAKQRRAAEAGKANMVNIARRELAAKLKKLVEKGWPTPPIPALPWDDIHAREAAAAIRIRSADNRSVCPAGASSTHHTEPIEDILCLYSTHIKKPAHSDSSKVGLQKEGSSPSLSETDGTAVSGTLQPSNKWRTALSTGKILWNIQRKGTANSLRTWIPQRPRIAGQGLSASKGTSSEAAECDKTAKTSSSEAASPPKALQVFGAIQLSDPGQGYSEDSWEKTCEYLRTSQIVKAAVSGAVSKTKRS
jgi:hypothetical protein